jgi:Kef-type K+ transport system membrane component KefB
MAGSGRGAAWQFVLGIGMACAVTALPILILLMEKLAILRQPSGQRILRYASLDDIAIWGVLALILMDWGPRSGAGQGSWSPSRCSAGPSGR